MPTSQDNHHVTVPCWALFPKTALLQILLFINIFLKKKSRNPFSIILAICISAKKNTEVFAHRCFPGPLTSTCSAVSTSCSSGHSTEGTFVTDTDFFSLNYKFHSTVPAGRRLCYRFYFPPLQNQLFQSCPATAPKGQPCQRDAVAASVKPQPLQLSPCLTRAAFYKPPLLFPRGFLKRQTGCTAQGSQNLDIRLFSARRRSCLFPWPVLEAAPAERAGGERPHVGSSGGEAGVAPHGRCLGITP